MITSIIIYFFIQFIFYSNTELGSKPSSALLSDVRTIEHYIIIFSKPKTQVPVHSRSNIIYPSFNLIQRCHTILNVVQSLKSVHSTRIILNVSVPRKYIPSGHKSGSDAFRSCERVSRPIRLT